MRAGDHFYVKVNGGASFKVQVSATDTMQSLVNRINSALVLKGEATLTRSGGDGVRITAREGNFIELVRGADGFDALAGLGIEPGKLDNTKEVKPANATKKELNVFALDLDANAVIGKKIEAKTLSFQLESALETLKAAYRALTQPAQKAVNANDQRLLASYRAL